jgi:N-acyl-D-aspartate/D-glutamate deacylase
MKPLAFAALFALSMAFGFQDWSPQPGSRVGPQDRYDVVIRGGRVVDPETGLDRVMNVAVRGDTIARIAPESLTGTRIIDAGGLVVAPGFIDLHSHGQNTESYRLQALDGVTTALEMEIGAADIMRFLKEREGRTLINFGATASHPTARLSSFGATAPPGAIVPPAGPATNSPAKPDQIARMKEILSREIDQGGLGVGMGITYTPGATRLEVIEMFRLAAERRVPVFVHVRSAGRIEPGSSIEAVGEVIGAAALTGASLHIVHINSTGLRDAAECLNLVAGARARGLDVTTEGYPYGAGMTAVNSALFNPGWRERLGIDYKDLQLIETGERLTKESFDRLHAMPEPKLVLLYLNPDEIVDSVMTHPLVMVASDGHIERGKGHPRGSGTYARVLARYVRSNQRITLMDAIRKMSLMPAQRLERATLAARRKGRIQEGADADIVVFDAQTITDRATYDKPAEPSVGVRYLLVGGTMVVDQGAVATGVSPGRALFRSR